MEYKDLLRMELRENKKEIFSLILSGIQEAIEKNADIYYITDLAILGDKMTFLLRKEEWANVLEKARIFFEELEEYDSCKLCRDLKKKIS